MAAPSWPEEFEPLPQWLRDVVDRGLRDLQRPTPVELAFGVGSGSAGRMLLIVEPDGSRSGFWLERPLSAVEWVVEFVDYLQDQVFDQSAQTWGQARPYCPGHAHPAQAAVIGDEAWWTCPHTQERIAVVGRHPDGT